jgi:hypothetical protein
MLPPKAPNENGAGVQTKFIYISQIKTSKYIPQYLYKRPISPTNIDIDVDLYTGPRIRQPTNADLEFDWGHYTIFRGVHYLIGPPSEVIRTRTYERFSVIIINNYACHPRHLNSKNAKNEAKSSKVKTRVCPSPSHDIKAYVSSTMTKIKQSQAKS